MSTETDALKAAYQDMPEPPFHRDSVEYRETIFLLGWRACKDHFGIAPSLTEADRTRIQLAVNKRLNPNFPDGAGLLS